MGEGTSRVRGIDGLREADFPLKRRGYDKHAVHAYLNRLADWIEARTWDNGDLADKERAAKEYSLRTRAEADSYAAAQRERAQAEADAIRAKAKREALAMVSQAAEVRNEIVDDLFDRIEAEPET